MHWCHNRSFLLRFGLDGTEHIRRRRAAPLRAALAAAGLAVAVLIPRPVAAQAPAAIVNEMSQGAGGAREWVEVLVVAPRADLRGWELGDNDDGAWHPIAAFRNVPAWSNVAAGTLIVLYNGGDRDTALPPDDLDPADGALVIGSDNTALLADAPNGWPAAGVFANDDTDDAPALRDAAGVLAHDMAVTHPIATVTAPGSQGSKRFVGNATAQLSDPARWVAAPAASATPAAPNGGDNTLWVAQLRGGGVPLAGFTGAAAASREGAGPAEVAVALSAPSAATVTVEVAVADAPPGAGVAFATHRLVFAPGVMTNTAALAIADDAASEPRHVVTLALTNAAGCAVDAARARLLLAIDDDDPPAVRFAADAAAVHETAGAVILPAERVGDTTPAAACRWIATAGTAAAWADFAGGGGMLAFAPGATAATVRVAIRDDRASEPDETFRVDLTPAPGDAATLSPSSVSVTILDDERAAANYYAGIDGLRGAALRAALHARLANHTRIDYALTPAALVAIDACPTNPAQVWLLYAQQGRDAALFTALTNGWNREHVWPRSRGFADPDFLLAPSCDLHNLRAEDAAVNGLRGNLDFDAGGAPVPGAPATCRYDADSFEPPDASKGDVARIVLYMDLRYDGDTPGEPDLVATNALGASGPALGGLATLLAWHAADPPDAFERRRNDLIWRDWQGNRNPFIDRPEWALELWGPGIVTRGGPDGIIAPPNPRVAPGGSVVFAIRAAPHAFIAGIRTNGAPAAVTNAAACDLAWNDIRATGELAVDFVPRLAAGLVPHAWLARHNLPTNDAAAEEDADRDGALNWEEYVAGTAPTNGVDERPAIGALLAGSRGPPALLVARTATNRQYRALGADRPDAGAWTPAGEWERGNGGNLPLQPSNTAARAWYRAAVRVAPDGG